MKTRTDKNGQLVAQDLLPATPMEAAQRAVLTLEYHKAKGNISLTARSVGWSRTKTLRQLKALDLYKLYKHDPWPATKGEN